MEMASDRSRRFATCCQACDDQRALDPPLAGTSAVASARCVTGRALAAHVQLHPATLYAHLKQIRQLAVHEMRAAGLQ
jgi:hypothetical protein